MSVTFGSCILVGLATHQSFDRKLITETCGDQPIFTSVITLGELGFGVQACKDPAERATRVAYLRQVETKPTLEVTIHTASAFAVLVEAVKLAGRSPRPHYNDLWIAAQAIEHGYSLLTLNLSDFDSLPSLRLLSINS